MQKQAKYYIYIIYKFLFRIYYKINEDWFGKTDNVQ